jgi:hypothetical protein
MPEHPPSATSVRRQIDAEVGPILRASRKLWEVGDEILVASPRTYLTAGSNIVTAEVSRASKTFGAILRLGEEGYGEQGHILARGLFESVISAHWAHKNADLAFERHGLYDKLLRQKIYESAVATKGLFDPGKRPPPLTAEERSEAERLFGPQGTRYWTGHESFREMVASVEDAWTPGWERRQLWAYFEVTHGYSNRFAHSNPLSIGVAFQDDAGRHVYDIGPSPRFVRPAVTAGTFCYTEALDLYLDHYGIAGDERKEFERAGRACWESWQDPTGMI